jgi:TolA-binding protein
MSTQPTNKHLVWSACGLAFVVVALSLTSTHASAQNAPDEQAKAANQAAAAPAKPTDEAAKVADEIDRRLRRIERAIERLGGKLDDNLDPNIIQAADPEIAIQLRPEFGPADGQPFKTTIQWVDLVMPGQAEDELKSLKKKRSELVEKLLETFDEIRQTEAKIDEMRKRLFNVSAQ